jgi:SNF2 family DNA or RNA helicase
VLGWLTRLRRLSCHPRLFHDAWTGASSKLDAFMALVDELRATGHRALVFSQFTDHLALVREALTARGIATVYLDGSTPVDERARAVESFQRGEGDLFLISLKAGGTGLNLTAADHVIHLDPWWNPAVEDQATDRAHRIGQSRPVTVIRLIAQGTIEEAVLALHAEKRDLAERLLEGTDAVGRLSAEDLVELVRRGSCCTDAARWWPDDLVFNDTALQRVTRHAQQPRGVDDVASGVECQGAQQALGVFEVVGLESDGGSHV